MNDFGKGRRIEPRRIEPGRIVPNAQGEYVLGRDGQPLRDRYGRPVRKRESQPARIERPPRYRAEPPRPRQEYQRRMPPGQVPPPAKPQPKLQPRPRRRRARRSFDFLGCMGWGAAILVVLIIASVLWADSRLNRIEALPQEQVADTAGTNWLLVGSDSRQGLSGEEIAALGTGGDLGVSRTDTIMLVHLPRSGPARLISIPRDSLVYIPGYGEDKINAAFAYGGAPLLTSTVEQATGLHIDHYAEIGMGGLAKLVDAVGGVEICVEEPIQDPLANLDVQPGCQNMDGPTALGYVRTRATAMGDLDRVQRQRQFFGALISEIASPATILNPFRLFSLVNSGTATFTVGAGEHVWHLGRLALAMSSGVNTETVPVGGFADTYVGNVIIWDEVAAEEMWASMR